MMFFHFTGVSRCCPVAGDARDKFVAIEVVMVEQKKAAVEEESGRHLAPVQFFRADKSVRLHHCSKSNTQLLTQPKLREPCGS